MTGLAAREALTPQVKHIGERTPVSNQVIRAFLRFHLSSALRSANDDDLLLSLQWFSRLSLAFGRARLGVLSR